MIINKVVEGWSGTESFSKVARELGYEAVTFDNNPIHNPTHCVDLSLYHNQRLFLDQCKDAQVVWMSPVCTGWTLAAGNTHWTEFRQPKTKVALESMKMMMFARLVADECIKHNKIFFIENPNGRAVWILDNQYLKRAWYCRYEDTRAKPTNIWTNLDIKFKTCFNGNKDCHHEAAPRGSKTGTQGLSNDIERSRIPPKLIHEIFEVLNTPKHRIRK